MDLVSALFSILLVSQEEIFTWENIYLEPRFKQGVPVVAPSPVQTLLHGFPGTLLLCGSFPNEFAFLGPGVMEGLGISCPRGAFPVVPFYVDMMCSP